MTRNQIAPRMAFVLAAFLALAAAAHSATLVRPGESADDGDRAAPSQLRVVPVPAPELGVYPRPYPSPFAAYVSTNRSRYRIGDEVRITYRVTEDAYIYIFNTDARGRTRQIFPNYYDRDNFARSGRTYSLPDRSYRLVTDGPQGRESIHLVAYRQRWRPLEQWDRYDRKDPFPVPRVGLEDMKRRVEKESRAADEKARAEELKSGSDRSAPQSLRIEPRPIEPTFRYNYAEAYAYFTITGQPYSPGRDYPPYYYDPLDHRGPGGSGAPYDPYFSNLRVESYPPNAEVFVDGQFIGRAPDIFRLSPGSHEVIIRQDDYNSAKYNIHLLEGRTQTISSSLTPARR